MAVNPRPRGKPAKERSRIIPERELAPLNSIILITPSEIVELLPDEIRSENVGWKAFGLSSVPRDWVPNFFVIHADCLETEKSRNRLSTQLEEAISKAGIRTPAVMVRSSGTSETIQFRGRLKSASCSESGILEAVQRCIDEGTRSVPGKVHWIIQEFVRPQRHGHLSNERHVSKEKRDWVAELELKEEASGYSIPIAVRRWRDGDRVSDLSLACTAELEISFCLKRVAMWAERLKSRMHFEWVWNGSAIRVVQADIADSIGGVNPASLVPDTIPDISVESLSVFRPASEIQYARYSKLRNASLYLQLGYSMPTFYVLEDAASIASILEGTMPGALARDIIELTKRPLILRTDGMEIPSNKREMLPRSDELRSLDEVREWLLGPFKEGVERDGLKNSSLCLIGHHFIPSLASAWARAELGNRLVRIEALWGLPDGLYWYSHDTYEVDTRDVIIRPPRSKETLSTITGSVCDLRERSLHRTPTESGFHFARSLRSTGDQPSGRGSGFSRSPVRHASLRRMRKPRLP